VVLDCFGLMHAADQAAALAERAERLVSGGTLLLQYHSLETIIRLGQWNALRHGHFAYYSATALSAMLASAGFSPRTAWHFELYGGTVLLAAGRDGDADDSVRTLLASEAQAGVRDPEVLGGLEREMRTQASQLREWLGALRDTGASVLGYGAASRAVSLLVQAGVDASLLPAVVDASPAKHGCRMPGTDIPVVGPSELALRGPKAVLLFLPDLLTEVVAEYPEVESAGGRWVDVGNLGADIAFDVTRI